MYFLKFVLKKNKKTNHFMNYIVLRQTVLRWFFFVVVVFCNLTFTSLMLLRIEYVKSMQNIFLKKIAS